MLPTEPFCSYCNKDLSKIDGSRVSYRVALFLKTENSVIQVCDNCTVQVFIQNVLSKGINAEDLIDICDNVLLRE